MLDRKGFATISLNVIIAMAGVIAVLIGLLYIQSSRIESRDGTIKTMKEEKVQDNAKGENKVFEKEHEVLGNQIKPKEVKHEEVNLSIGTHRVWFGGMH